MCSVTDSVQRPKKSLFQCPVCKYKVNRRDNLKRHMNRVHGMQCDDKMIIPTPKNKCNECKEVFYHTSAMVKHLDQAHSLQMDIENKLFASFQEFLDWKDFEERSCFVYFTKRDEKNNENLYSSNISYVCYFHRSSCQVNAKLKSVDHIKLRRKCNKVCSARMLVQKNFLTDQVNVKYVKTHSHSVSYEDQLHHPLSTSIKNEIKEKLREGLTVQDIYSSLCQKATVKSLSDVTKTRFCDVNFDTAKIEYMQKKLLLPRNILSSMNFEDRFLSFTTDQFNPILLHSPGCKDSFNGNHCIGFQTAEQLSIFQKHAPKMLFIECTNPVPSIPFHILTLKVFDENLHGLNVARLVMSIYDEEVVALFLKNLIKRCTSDVLAIQNLMTDYSSLSLKPFCKVFKVQNILYSKYHIHQLMFIKFLSDYPGHLELLHNIYYSLMKIIEEMDKDQFKKLTDAFIGTYKNLCGIYVEYILCFFDCPERWAMCYRDPALIKCDSTLHLDGTLQKLRASRKGLLKETCSWNELIHHLLNLDQVSYLKFKQLQLSSISLVDHHKAGLAIPSEDVIRTQSGQWLVFFENMMFEVNFKTEVCPDKFCSIRCLEVACCNLCQHWYTCSCQCAPMTICAHIHKVHATALLPK